MSTKERSNVDVFNRDVAAAEGYLYTAPERVSSRLANERLSRAVRTLVALRDKDVLDVGCGDGTYTVELLSLHPRSVLGVDAAANAIERARSLVAGDTRIAFETMNAEQLGKLGRRYDVAIVRGLLHHLEDPVACVDSLLQVADEIVVVEPNGYNPVLKIIEKASKYHRDHEERSFPPRRLEQWFSRRGAVVDQASYCGLVPFFCPTPLARVLKVIEPLIERLPLVRALSCAVYVMRVRNVQATR